MKIEFGCPRHNSGCPHVTLCKWGLPFSTYAPGGRGGVQVSYTFPLRITCKKGGKGVQIAYKIAYVLNQGAYRFLKINLRPLLRCFRTNFSGI